MKLTNFPLKEFTRQSELLFFLTLLIFIFFFSLVIF